MLTFILNVLNEGLDIGNLYCTAFYSAEVDRVRDQGTLKTGFQT